MGELVEGDDGLPAEEVGLWAKDKFELLCDYIQISSATRKKYLTPAGGNGGATYIDLFCGTGRAKIKSTGEFVDAGCVAAWRRSVETDSPFTRVIIGDKDPDRLNAAHMRLERLGAPVTALLGTAKDKALSSIQKATSNGLNFAFLDPYSLGVLDFEIIATLARLRRIDMLVHVSQMDLQRNFDRNSTLDDSSLDTFAPGWREGADTQRSQKAARQAYFQYWKDLVSTSGAAPAAEMRLITGPGNQPLYLLLLAAKHELAHKFWETVAKKDDGQERLF